MLLLGHELKNDELKKWANQELSGYENGNEAPAYRVIPAEARGDFAGPFHAQYLRHLIPSAALEVSAPRRQPVECEDYLASS